MPSRANDAIMSSLKGSFVVVQGNVRGMLVLSDGTARKEIARQKNPCL
jgi:hypothetical protein